MGAMALTLGHGPRCYLTALWGRYAATCTHPTNRSERMAGRLGPAKGWRRDDEPHNDLTLGADDVLRRC